jgi:hypothetical protein
LHKLDTSPKISFSKGKRSFALSVIEYPKDEKPSPGQHEIQSKIGKETPSFSFGTSSREGMIFYHFESKSYLLIVDN